MKIFSIICLVLTFGLNNCFYKFVEEFFKEEDVSEWDFTDWSTNYPNINDMVYECAGDSIVGGYQKFEGDIFLEYENLDTIYPHSKIKIEFQLFQLDKWENNDKFYVKVDNVIVATFEKVKNRDKDPVCGNMTQRPKWKDFVQNVVLEVPHTAEKVDIRFESDFNSNDNTEESWGINNVKIYAYVDCGYDAYLYDFGDSINGSDFGCLSKTKAKECYDLLVELDKSLQSDCDYEVTGNNEHIYEFWIQYLEDFEFDPICFNQRLYFEDTLLTENAGTPGPDQWSFTDEPASASPVTGTILGKVKHSDLITPYSCNFLDMPDKFKWSCDIHLHIAFNNTDQLKYTFTMKTELGKGINSEAQVLILPNVVQGSCCENVLEVDTELKICEDETCQGYEDLDPLTPFPLVRNTPITIEHSIVTQEFKDYYLDVKTLTIGPFAPKWEDIISYTSEKGRTFITFAPFVAMSGIQIQVTSKLDTVESQQIGDSRRILRNLQEEGDEDHFTDAEGLVRNGFYASILDESDSDIVNESENIQVQTDNNKGLIDKEVKKQDTYQIITILIGVFGALVAIGVLGISVYIRNLHKKSKVRVKFMNDLQSKKASESSLSKAE